MRRFVKKVGENTTGTDHAAVASAGACEGRYFAGSDDCGFDGYSRGADRTRCTYCYENVFYRFDVDRRCVGRPSDPAGLHLSAAGIGCGQRMHRLRMRWTRRQRLMLHGERQNVSLQKEMNPRRADRGGLQSSAKPILPG